MQMVETIYKTVTFETETCYRCGILFAMPAEIRQRKLREGGDFYCPNGHGQHYAKTTEQRLREQLERERNKTIREQSAREQIQAEVNELRKKNNKIIGKLSRVYKRVRNGVCPCCNRHFDNLEGHMKTKHGARL